MSDHDDFRHLMDADEEMMPRGLSRWLPAVVVLAVVGGFVSLAWYAYKAGTQSVKDEDLLVVEADKTPMKEKPVDPGGMKFPNQDKTIFETFNGNGAPPPKVERVLPLPEEPMPKEADNSGTTTWVNEKLQKDRDSAVQPAAGPEQVIGMEEGTPEPQFVAPKEEAKPAEKPTEAAVEKPAQKPAEKIAEKPVEPAKALDHAVSSAADKAVKPEVKKDEKKPLAKTESKAPVKTGPIAVQLGSYRSESEAKNAWKGMEKKHGSLLAGMQPTIAKADLGERGVYYRLKLLAFTSAVDANAFCGKMAAQGQACILAAAK